MIFLVRYVRGLDMQGPPAPYGGSRMYRQALPFFLGLILGDFVTGAAWSIIGTVLHVNLFRTFAR